MTAKELLTKIIKLRKAIDYRNTKIAGLMAEAEKTTSHLTGLPHNPSKDTSPMASAVCKKVELENEIKRLKEERDALIAKLDLLEDDDLSRILTLRYVQEEKWEDIMVEMNYCRAHIFRLHCEAVKEMDQILKDETK